MYTRAPEGELAGELGVWRRTVMDPCGPGRTSVSTAPIDGQGPTPSWVWSRRPAAIGTSAPRVGPDGSHAPSSGSRTPRPTMSGTCAASYTGIFTPPGRAGNRSSDRRARLQAHGSAFRGVDDLLSSGDLAEVGDVRPHDVVVSELSGHDVPVQERRGEQVAQDVVRSFLRGHGRFGAVQPAAGEVIGDLRDLGADRYDRSRVEPGCDIQAGIVRGRERKGRSAVHGTAGTLRQAVTHSGLRPLG